MAAWRASCSPSGRALCWWRRSTRRVPPRTYRAWRDLHADALAAVPPQALRVEYGRAPAGGLFVRVRLAEEYLPPGLAS